MSGPHLNTVITLQTNLYIKIKQPPDMNTSSIYNDNLFQTSFSLTIWPQRFDRVAKFSQCIIFMTCLTTVN